MIAIPGAAGERPAPERREPAQPAPLQRAEPVVTITRENEAPPVVERPRGNAMPRVRNHARLMRMLRPLQAERPPRRNGGRTWELAEPTSSSFDVGFLQADGSLSAESWIGDGAPETDELVVRTPEGEETARVSLPAAMTQACVADASSRTRRRAIANDRYVLVFPENMSAIAVFDLASDGSLMRNARSFAPSASWEKVASRVMLRGDDLIFIARPITSCGDGMLGDTLRAITIRDGEESTRVRLIDGRRAFARDITHRPFGDYLVIGRCSIQESRPERACQATTHLFGTGVMSDRIGTDEVLVVSTDTYYVCPMNGAACENYETTAPAHLWLNGLVAGQAVLRGDEEGTHAVFLDGSETLVQAASEGASVSRHDANHLLTITKDADRFTYQLKNIHVGTTLTVMQSALETFDLPETIAESDRPTMSVEGEASGQLVTLSAGEQQVQLRVRAGQLERVR